MRINDLFGCAGSAIILLFVSSWVPFVGPFFSLLAPLPFLYYATKLGPYEGIKVAAITVIIAGGIAHLLGYSQVIFLAVEFGFLGLLISEAYRRGYSFGVTLFGGTLFMLLIGLTILILIGVTKELGPFELILNYFQNNLSGTIQTYENMGWDQTKIQQFQEYAKILTKVISTIYPALMVIGTGFVVWVNIIISRPLFRLRHLKYPDFGSLDRWRAPEHMVWGLIASGFCFFLSIPGVKLLAINVLMVMLVIYIFHGLAIVVFFLNKYRVPSWIRIGIYLLIIFQQIFLIGLGLAGLFDQWIDFRKIHSRRNSKK